MENNARFVDALLLGGGGRGVVSRQQFPGFFVIYEDTNRAELLSAPPPPRRDTRPPNRSFNPWKGNIHDEGQSVVIRLENSVGWKNSCLRFDVRRSMDISGRWKEVFLKLFVC